MLLQRWTDLSNITFREMSQEILSQSYLGSPWDKVPPHKHVFFDWNVESSSWNIWRIFSVVHSVGPTHSYTQPFHRQSCLSLQPCKAPSIPGTETGVFSLELLPSLVAISQTLWEVHEKVLSTHWPPGNLQVVFISQPQHFFFTWLSCFINLTLHLHMFKPLQSSGGGCEY